MKFAKFSRTLFLQNTSGAASTLVKAEIPICSSLFISLHYCISPLIKVCAKPRKDSAVSHHLLNCQCVTNKIRNKIHYIIHAETCKRHLLQEFGE